MKIVSWNVNGMRSILGKGFPDFLAENSPDILCLQETKARREQVPCDFDGYHVIWNAAGRPGYSGTAILSRKPPVDVRFGIGTAEHDGEGRVVTAEYSHFHLVNVYVPNAGRELARLEYRVKAWGPAFRNFLAGLERKKPVIFCGDMNVARSEIDLARPNQNVGNAGFTKEEREDFERLLGEGFIDSFREVQKDGGHYSWWSYQSGARARNIGWRIDYVGISPALRPRMTDAFILPDVMGSDHCPVGVEL